jgi:histidine ammonia-lyase
LDPSPVELERPITIHALESVARGGRVVVLDAATKHKIQSSRRAVERIARAGDDAPRVYGVNTGFGALSETRIGADDVRSLQQNLVRSHSTAIGPEMSSDRVRGMMLLRAQTLALGHSGVRLELVELIIAMLERGVVPRIPSQGSVGASGDLAPLAHLALAMIGEGEAYFDGECRPGARSGAPGSLRSSCKPRRGYR